ncbi:hypothetical protein DXG03_008059, partial [Asterophora parasitica]
HQYNHYVPAASPTKGVYPYPYSYSKDGKEEEKDWNGDGDAGDSSIRRGSRVQRHRYSKSLTAEEGEWTRRSRSRADTVPSSEASSNNPKAWTPEQLASNVPEIAEFVLEHEVSGRAFLRFDEGVLDA